jgi:hypothetical protein
MKRVVLSVSIAAALAALVWSTARGRGGGEGLCALLTPAKLLENPALAEEYAGALRSGDAGEVVRVEHMLRDIRSVHGCAGEVTLPAHPYGHSEPPPGHPPVRAPPLDDRGLRGEPIFAAPPPVTI